MFNISSASSKTKYSRSSKWSLHLFKWSITLPGVQIIKWGLFFSSLISSLIGFHQYKSKLDILLSGENEAISSLTWIASSRVGQRIIAFVALCFVFISWSNGIQKEAVFQVQVWAWPMISLFQVKKTGITCSWIGEGFWYPFFSIDSRISSLIPKSLNVFFIYFLYKL